MQGTDRTIRDGIRGATPGSIDRTKTLHRFNRDTGKIEAVAEVGPLVTHETDPGGSVAVLQEFIDEEVPIFIEQLADLKQHVLNDLADEIEALRRESFFAGFEWATARGLTEPELDSAFRAHLAR